MKKIDTGLKEVVNELAEEIMLGIEEANESIRFGPNHKHTICFLIFRFGPDVVFDSMGGISLNGANYFVNRLRRRCAKTYQSLFEERV